MSVPETLYTRGAQALLIRSEVTTLCIQLHYHNANIPTWSLAMAEKKTQESEPPRAVQGEAEQQ